MTSNHLFNKACTSTFTSCFSGCCCVTASPLCHDWRLAKCKLKNEMVV
ncbi:hypothetical protein QWZ13_18900 [Reinekea marina]|nr:hypothetical protein [Reinekea marina]MDN3650982.1 hypothetical protein [Reinekea marina]